jgi:hypothetical protein
MKKEFSDRTLLSVPFSEPFSVLANMSRTEKRFRKWHPRTKPKKEFYLAPFSQRKIK